MKSLLTGTRRKRAEVKQVFVSIKGYDYRCEIDDVKVTWKTPHNFPTQVFVSMKGYDYQCEIDGVKVAWKTPHNFPTQPMGATSISERCSPPSTSTTPIKFVNFYGSYHESERTSRSARNRRWDWGIVRMCSAAMMRLNPHLRPASHFPDAVHVHSMAETDSSKEYRVVTCEDDKKERENRQRKREEKEAKEGAQSKSCAAPSRSAGVESATDSSTSSSSSSPSVSSRRTPKRARDSPHTGNVEEVSRREKKRVRFSSESNTTSADDVAVASSFTDGDKVDDNVPLQQLPEANAQKSPRMSQRARRKSAKALAYGEQAAAFEDDAGIHPMHNDIGEKVKPPSATTASAMATRLPRTNGMRRPSGSSRSSGGVAHVRSRGQNATATTAAAPHGKTGKSSSLTNRSAFQIDRRFSKSVQTEHHTRHGRRQQEQ